MNKQATIEKPWTMSRGGYQARRGVHRPWIAEIHPGVQYARLSKRARAEYDKKRAAQWDASAQCAQDYHNEVVAAYDAGLTTLQDPDLHPEAKSAILGALVQRGKDVLEARLKAAHEANRIESMDDVQVGDRIFSLMGAFYGKVVRKHKVSLQVEPETPQPWMGGKPLKVNLGAAFWLSHQDVNKTLTEQQASANAK